MGNNGGQFVKGSVPWNKGLKGIHLSPSTEIKKGQHLSPNTEYKGGSTPWIKDRKHSQATREKMSGTWFIAESEPWNKGIPTDNRQKERISKSIRSKYDNDPGYRQRISRSTRLAMQNVDREKLAYWRGKERPFKSRIKQSEAMKTIWAALGANPSPYPFEYNNELRKSILNRDRGCLICRRQTGLHIHHKDGNKSNNNPNNLITLCSHCHIGGHRKGAIKCESV